MGIDLNSKLSVDIGTERKLNNEWNLVDAVVDAVGSRCYACRLPILDHFLLSVHPGVKFHERCLRCGECGRLLSEKDVCYCVKAQIYCAHDFYRLFGERCDNCNERFGAGEKVMRTERSTTYHPYCFRCFKCNKLIASGESYTLHGTKLFCSLEHKMEAFTTHESSNIPNDNNTNNNNSFVTTENKIYNTKNKISSTNNVYNVYNNIYNINNNKYDMSNNAFNLKNNNSAFDLNNNNNSENSSNSNNDTFDLNNNNNIFNLNNNNNTSNSNDIKWDMKTNSPQLNNYQQESEQNHQNSQQQMELQQLQLHAAKLPQHSEKIQPLATSSTSTTVSSPTLSTSPTESMESTRKAPRHRTPMTESQLSVLKSFYRTNCRPDGIDRDSLSLITGLHARVIRVWFQNKRCKDKKDGNAAAVSAHAEQ